MCSKIRRLIAFAIFIFLSSCVSAQLYDAQWAFGSVRPTVMEAKNDSAILIDSLAPIGLALTSASICDTAGNLLFASNGFSIYDKFGHVLQNGDSISPCQYSNQNSSQLPISQCVLFIPKPKDDSLYYLFHYSYDTLQDARPGKIYYSLINAKANNGLGAVLEKNHLFYSGVIFSGCRMTATKHANGRDWWLVLHGWRNNFFYKFLVQPDTVLLSDVQAIGPVFQNWQVDYRGQSKFSQDGSVFATIAIQQKLLVLDFDRCIGQFSNPRTRWNNASNIPAQQSATGGISLEFSPNGQFVYTSIVENGKFNIAQYEVAILGSAGDSSMAGSIDTTGNNENAGVDVMQLAYNGKIYASCFQSPYKFLHVIHKPDLKGTNCNFVYGGQPTYSLGSQSVPNLVNYRLGALFGSGCDTITGIKQQPLDVTQQPRIQPNPADKGLYVEMPMQGEYLIQLLNEAGQLVETKQTRQVDIFNVESLASGVYFLSVKDAKSSSKIATQKVVIQHP